ncbi:MAG TPA: WYL domain-containing protein, partial [Acinetobacter schindleri]|nr:WYL domain-containing protein [Acinetobacter schindleri]
DIQTFALHRFKSANVLNTRALHPVNFDIDEYIESGALGFRVNFDQPTENVMLKLHMPEADAHYFEESQLSRDQQIEKLDHGMALISATVPFTSQLVWWLRSFGNKIQKIEPEHVSRAVYQQDEA